MKFKKIVPVMLCLAALAAVPAIPAVRNSLPDMSITADAATTPTSYYKYTTGGITYELDTKNKEAHVYSYTGSPSTVNIPATVNYVGVNYPIVSIRSNAFKNCSTLYKLNLGSATNMRSIGANAFAGSSVQYVDLKGTSLTIGEGAFRDTQKLIDVYVYSAVNSLTIEKEAFTGSFISSFQCYAKNLMLKTDSFVRAGRNLSFYIYSYTDTATIQTCAFGASSITNLDIYCRNITIEKDAFWGKGIRMDSASLTNVFFGSNTKIITLYDGAFRSLASLGSVTFNNPTADVFMGKSMFAGSTLKNITLPASLTKIPDYCFEGCQSLATFPMAANVTSIGKNAFSNAKLPATVSLSNKVTSIDRTAFTNVKGVKAFSVADNNPNYKAEKNTASKDMGVLYSKNGSTLLCYPPLKTNSEYSTSASVIPDGAFSYNTYLKNLSIANLSRSYSETVEFPGLANLEKLTIPTADYNQSGSYIMRRYHSLFYATKLHQLNGVEMLTTKSNGEPCFITKFQSYFEDNLSKELDDYCFVMKSYTEKMTEYVVNTFTTSTMSDLKKAVRLHEWICKRTTYDPRVIADDDYYDEGDHTYASVFLHRDTINGVRKNVTVCEGYAKCYKLLMNKAGIETQEVVGRYTDVNGKEHGHAWNLVKLNGNWYHVDVTWDDENFDERNSSLKKINRYQYFLCPDAVFNNDGHRDYNWHSEDDSSLYKGRSVATDYNYYRLGDVNNDALFNSADQNKFDQFANGTAPNAMQKIRGDLNFDGKVNGSDRDRFNSYINTYKNTYSRPALWLFTTLEY